MDTHIKKQIAVGKIWHTGDIKLALLHFDLYAKKCYVGEIKLREFPESSEPKPTMILDATMAQELMDGLWRCGVRPTDGAGSAGQMASVQQHLADMRKICFHKLNIKETT